MRIPTFSNLMRGLAGLALIATLSACKSENVEIPSAHVGKISTANGLKDGILPPSRLRLSGWCRLCDSVILAEVGDYPMLESMTLFMPKDNLNITIDVRGTFATADTNDELNMIFGRMSAVPTGQARVSMIPSGKVYETYAQQIVRDRVRAIVAQYSIATLMENRESIGGELREEVRKALEGRPVKVLNFGLADIQPPDIILNAEIKRKAREIAIKEAEANKEVRLRDAEADLAVAQQQQAVELLEAETHVMVEQKMREGFSEAYVAQRGLKVLEALANSTNKVIFLPSEALQNPSVMIGGFLEATEARSKPMVAAASQ